MHLLQSYRRRGSALIVVIALIAIMAILTASTLKYTMTERRGNERNRLILRAKNMAENVALYSSEQISTKLHRMRTVTLMKFTTGVNQIYMPPTSLLTTSFSGPSDVEAYGGITSNTGLNLVTDTTSTNYGLQVLTGTVPIIAKSTMTHAAIGSVTSYAEQDLEISEVPLFQFAIFYNKDLEFSPGADMVISGPVHSNGDLIARGQTGFANTVRFKDRVSAVGAYYANSGHKGTTYNEYDNADQGPGGTGPLVFENPTGTQMDIKNSVDSVYRDHKWTSSAQPWNVAVTTTSEANFKAFALQNYGANFRTSAHGVGPLELPGLDTTAVNSARSTIEAPDAADSVELITAGTQISRKAGLYIIVNPTAQVRTGHLPDASTVSMRAYSYRCWLNTVSTTGTHSLAEVVLPGQPSYGPLNAYVNKVGQPGWLPNAYRADTSVGSNQVLRIPYGFAPEDAAAGYTRGAPTLASFQDAYFYDMRRAANSNGHPFDRGTSAFVPRPIAKIDFDMARFKMCVNRTLAATGATVLSTDTTTTGYNVDLPTAANWNNNILKSDATTTVLHHGTGLTFNTLPAIITPLLPDPFRIYFAPADPTDVATAAILAANPSAYGVGLTNLYNSGVGPWYDGISIYIHSVDAEVVTAAAPPVRDRMDSGVRLWNGRGPAPTLTAAGSTGFTLCTNDPVYIIGHFNADGVINSDDTSVTAYGGYSARYPDSANEYLAAVMGDSLTIYSQPVYTNVGGYYQVSGWSDSLSANRCRNSGWNAAWSTTNPATGNTVDGTATNLAPANMPNLGNIGGTGTGPARDYKFLPSVTEISACLLTGIVETNSHQNSGGVHNFPRLNENWSGTGLYIRGSMIAMFASEIASEPWSIRNYSGAGRFWGLHQSLRSAAHDVPLEPMLIGASRLGYKELTPTEYAARKATILALP